MLQMLFWPNNLQLTLLYCNVLLWVDALKFNISENENSQVFKLLLEKLTSYCHLFHHILLNTFIVKVRINLKMENVNERMILLDEKRKYHQYDTSLSKWVDTQAWLSKQHNNNEWMNKCMSYTQWRKQW